MALCHLPISLNVGLFSTASSFFRRQEVIQTRILLSSPLPQNHKSRSQNSLFLHGKFITLCAVELLG